MTSRTPAGDLFTDTVMLLLRANGLLQRAAEKLTKSADQTAARWQIIGSIDKEPRTVAEIARRMESARQSVQRIADVLAGEGLVVYKENPGHRRAHLVALTQSGWRALRVIRAEQCIWANRVSSQLGMETLARIGPLLQQFIDALRSDPLGAEDA
jgi:DNA-binding MarR family transcriptional regulator